MRCETICGVYALRCTVNRRVYVGSSVDINRRIFDAGGHLWALRKGKHRNSKLQADFEKHGDGAFEAALVQEASTVADARALEQDWLDCIFQTIPSEIYNIARRVEFYDGANRQRECVLIAPDGKETRFVGVKRFCRERGLDRAAITRVLKNPRFSYKGWRHSPNSPPPLPPTPRKPPSKSRSEANRKRYVLRSPTGEVIEVVGIGEFCKSKGLPKSSMFAMFNDPRKTCRGWTLIREEQAEGKSR